MWTPFRENFPVTRKSPRSADDDEEDFAARLGSRHSRARANEVRQRFGIVFARYVTVLTEQTTSTTPSRPVENWLSRIQAEYVEMPGLTLTRSQAQRLWGIDSQMCDLLLNALVETGFLRLTRTGTYVRADCAMRP